jgi:hypothetical protein
MNRVTDVILIPCHSERGALNKFQGDGARGKLDEEILE